MNQLEKARAIINEADAEIARQFTRRMEASRLVAAYKKEHALPVTDPVREEEVLRRSASAVEDPEIRSYYIQLQKEVMALSRSYQTKLLTGMRVAYSGTEGAFAHIAAGRIFPSAQRIAFGGFAEAYRAAEEGSCDCAVLPLENSYAGEVGQVTDLMFQGSLYVNGIYELKIMQDLIGLPGTALGDIKTVISHPQALSQCAPFIRKNGLREVPYANTATAARKVKTDGDPSVAAIASGETAKLYGLSVLAEGINESGFNTTRFAVFSRVQAEPALSAMESRFILVFTVRNQAGSLAEAVNIIGRHGFNMRTLRSRPMKDLPWEYYFYVEAEGCLRSAEGDAMLRELAGCCDRLKPAGTYRRHAEIG